MTDTVAGGLDDGASDSWRMLMARIAAQADEPIPDMPEPDERVTADIPLEFYASFAAVSLEETESLAEPQQPARPLADIPSTRLLDLSDLSSREAPPFEWWVPGWLSPHPTLLSGRGGVGKSLLALQLAMGCAVGKPLVGRAERPLNVLYWACEDDTDELHRRMQAISRAMDVPLSDLAGRLHVDARLGLDNTILATEFGRPAWTPRVEVLRQQLNDLQIDLLILDNLAHVFAASENDRAAVTMFAAGLCGLVLDRPWCPMLIGHVAKAQGSEYAGSTAWENAVRMRWFLGKTLPDAPEEEEGTDADIRVLAKRKTNYSTDDVLKMRVMERHFQVEQDEHADGSVVGALRQKKARRVIVYGIDRLRGMNIDCTETYSVNYLPALLLKYKLNEGLTKRDMDGAMRELLRTGTIERTIVGKTANRMPKYGLRVVSSEKTVNATESIS